MRTQQTGGFPNSLSDEGKGRDIHLASACVTTNKIASSTLLFPVQLSQEKAHLSRKALRTSLFHLLRGLSSVSVSTSLDRTEMPLRPHSCSPQWGHYCLFSLAWTSSKKKVRGESRRRKKRRGRKIRRKRRGKRKRKKQQWQLTTGRSLSVCL